MARPREFNEQEAIDRAVDVFWRKGFADTSIGDLENALGMGRQSIYNSFGDKRALYLRALQTYYDRGSAMLSSIFSDERRGLEAIYAYFDAVVDHQTQSDENRGCFIIKTLVDYGTKDAEVANQCKSNEARIIDRFKTALKEAIEDHALPASTDVEATAMMLATHVYGLSVQARSGASSEELRTSTHALLKRLVR